jgi:23S rRNA (pseudouridine1915-N3)-methyltransferase
MRVGVIWFGKPAASPYEQQVETYRKRVSNRWQATDTPLRPVAGGRPDDAKKTLSAEADLVRRRLPRGCATAVMDERGQRLDSVAFASLLAELETSGSPEVTFIVGSDMGLDQRLCEEARYKLSLSPMTLPHLLARLLLWEQLFRATDILGAGRYHRLIVK